MRGALRGFREAASLSNGAEAMSLLQAFPGGPGGEEGKHTASFLFPPEFHSSFGFCFYSFVSHRESSERWIANSDQFQRCPAYISSHPGPPIFCPPPPLCPFSLASCSWLLGSKLLLSPPPGSRSLLRLLRGPDPLSTAVTPPSLLLSAQASPSFQSFSPFSMPRSPLLRPQLHSLSSSGPLEEREGSLSLSRGWGVKSDTGVLSPSSRMPGVCPIHKH